MSVWDRVIGQEDVVKTLQEAALASREILGETGASAGAGAAPDAAPDAESAVESTVNAWAMNHAWLITGPPGSGRSVAALAFAAALQCTSPEPGCGQCVGCKTAILGTHADVMVMSTEKVVINIEEVRALVSTAQMAPSQGRWRIILVEDVDRMKDRTSNMLLKAIEEPPAKTIWLLCAPSPEDVLTTIRSRCRGIGLRIPPASAVADLIVKREGIDHQTALEAAQMAQSHIGLASALARDPELREQRRRLISDPARIRSLTEAVLTAHSLIEMTKEQAKTSTEKRSAAEKISLMRSIGAEEGSRIPPALRSQLRQLEEEQKRRSKRVQLDVLDRAMLNLLSLYRDVAVVQLQAEVALVNVDLEQLIVSIGRETDLSQTLRRISAIELSRQRLATTNVAPLLIVEAMLIALLPTG